jgi:hypothetical protein
MSHDLDMTGSPLYLRTWRKLAISIPILAGSVMVQNLSGSDQNPQPFDHDGSKTATPGNNFGEAVADFRKSIEGEPWFSAEEIDELFNVRDAFPGREVDLS